MKSLHLRVAFVAGALFFGAAAQAEDDWTCGTWEKDPSGKCEEVRTCTRTRCKDIQDLTTCKKETRKECANPKPLPPKPAPLTPGAAPPFGNLPTSNDPGPKKRNRVTGQGTVAPSSPN